MKVKINIFVLIVAAVYAVLTVVAWDFCYFWDAVQQVSKEAHWFYLTDFSSLLIPSENAFGITSTGYHPPLLSMLTAALWKVFGYKIWVSHAFTAICAALLIYNLWKLLLNFLTKKYAGWVLLILLLEPAVLSQFVIVSPDFIIFTAFIIAFRAIFERKTVILSITMIFLCCINIRGAFVGAALFICNIFYEISANNSEKSQRFSIQRFTKILLPYLPVLLLLTAYYLYYFSQNGWFFGNGKSAYEEHYKMPREFSFVVQQWAAYVLRSIECGRIIIWLLSFYVFYIIFKNKINIAPRPKTLLVFVIIMYVLYFVLISVTQMPFGTRYFIPQFFALTLFALIFLIENVNFVKMKIIFAVILLFEITGHFWVYPEKIAQSWDSTLAHIPYYELRRETFRFIDDNKFIYNEIAGGFVISGNNKFIQLADTNAIIGGDMEHAKYFLYSNISNLNDEKIAELKNPQLWIPIKTFKKCAVFITVYKRNEK
ncbi:MAG: glycosyltransferase family 39 protein [Prevotellaceae bacterium]|jgi:hypothetical protein|nr:glycosyltransferase family 39 protein [Prevotellaceae bacterium]